MDSRAPGTAALILLIGLTSCTSGRAGGGAAPQIVQPGAPGKASRIVDAGHAADLSGVRFTPADVRFMQGMIAHHAQAVEMTALVDARTRRDDIRLLAQRIDLSQADEIRMMKDWLESRGESVPDEHAHHRAGGLMPGMLTADEMARLAAATGEEFDRLFLAFMIKHHEGALKMVEDLFATPGAGQDPEVFAFASDVDADQRMEIDRMRSLLAAR